MITREQFEAKVQSLTAKEIILLMLDAVENPVTDFLNMKSFGYIQQLDDDVRCYGCAATNLILRAMEIDREEWREMSVGYAKDRGSRMSPLMVQAAPPSSVLQSGYVRKLELAIDDLRRGRINAYNKAADELGMAKIRVKYNDEFEPIGIFGGDDSKGIEEFRQLAEQQV